MKDYYAILGLEWRASSREINEAYEILTDPGKRQAYDRRVKEARRVGRRVEGFSPFQDGHPFFSYFLRVNEALRKRDQK